MRSRTLSIERISNAQRLAILANPTPPDPDRPRTRGDCVDAVRPCPWVGCKWHLYLDVNPDTGTIKLNFPTLEPWEMVESCALDVADRSGITLEEVGAMMNMTRERIRQVELVACARFEAEAMRRGMDLRPDRDVQRGSGVEQEDEAAE